MNDDTILRLGAMAFVFGSYLTAAMQGHDGILLVLVTNGIIALAFMSKEGYNRWLKKQTSPTSSEKTS